MEIALQKFYVILLFDVTGFKFSIPYTSIFSSKLKCAFPGIITFNASNFKSFIAMRIEFVILGLSVYFISKPNFSITIKPCNCPKANLGFSNLAGSMGSSGSKKFAPIFFIATYCFYKVVFPHCL